MEDVPPLGGGIESREARADPLGDAMGSACGPPESRSTSDLARRTTGGAPSSDTDVALTALVSDAVDAIYLLDPEGRFLYANAATSALTGRGIEDLEGSAFADLVPPDEREHVRWMLGSALERDDPVTQELDLRGIDGGRLPVEVRSSRVVHDGRVVGVQGIARDVSSRRARTRELEHRALHDPLTNLPNRALLRDRLEQAVLVERRKGVPFALLVVDLDGFKEVNDDLGHAAGDRVLFRIAERLRGTVRASDTVARLGGDEFAVLVGECGVSGARTVAGKLLQALDRPVVVGGRSRRVGASIGIALCPDHGDDPEELLERADAAMYAAKRGRLGAAVHGVTHVDFGRRRARRSAPGSGRLSGFLAGAAAALLVVAGVSTPSLRRAPEPRTPAAPPATTEGRVGDAGSVDGDVERFLRGASVGPADGGSGDRYLSIVPAVFRNDGFGAGPEKDLRFRLDEDPDREVGEMRPFGGDPSPGAPDEGGGDEPEDGAPGSPGGGGQPSAPPKGKGGGGGRSGDGPSERRSDDGPARPRSPRRPASSRSGGGPDGGSERTVWVERRGGREDRSSGSGGSRGGGVSRGGERSSGAGNGGDAGSGGGKGNGGGGGKDKGGGNAGGGKGNGSKGRPA